ncbi:MAG: hypothetical protein AAFO69_16755 [Bacteroidota bacterium]
MNEQTENTEETGTGGVGNDNSQGGSGQGGTDRSGTSSQDPLPQGETTSEGPDKPIKTSLSSGGNAADEPKDQS